MSDGTILSYLGILVQKTKYRKKQRKRKGRGKRNNPVYRNPLRISTWAHSICLCLFFSISFLPSTHPLQNRLGRFFSFLFNSKPKPNQTWPSIHPLAGDLAASIHPACFTLPTQQSQPIQEEKNRKKKKKKKKERREVLLFLRKRNNKSSEQRLNLNRS